MEATPAHAAQLTPLAELVVQNGRQAGARRPLQHPLTLIGRAADCDVRLNVDGIQPLHCLLVWGPAGLVLRDLDSETGTYVNGARVSSCPVQDGDVLTVAAFQFRLAMVPGGPAPATAVVDAERDALRIQVAAVAAQQAGLTEQEARLVQQQQTLSEQQEQLAAHLEEKRVRLEQLAEQVQAARTARKEEHEEQTRLALRQQEELAGGLAELQEGRNKLHEDRKRLGGLRRRLKQRFHRRWTAERQQVHQGKKDLAAAQVQLEQQTKQLRQERDVLTRARLSFNGDVELGKRQLQAEWQKLWAEQKQLAEQRARQEAELAERVRTVRQREQALADAERSLGDERHRWQQRRKLLEKEVDGLESRINNQRRKLVEQQQEITEGAARLQKLRVAQTPILAVPVTAVALAEAGCASSQPPVDAAMEHQRTELRDRAAQLDRLAEELADQRVLLLEHWQHLVQVHQQWDEDRQSAADHLAALVVGLPLQEQTLVLRQRNLEAAEENLHERQRQLAQLRQHFEGRAAGVRLRESSWEAERDRLLLDVQQREALAETQLRALADLRQRWVKRRKQELGQLKADRSACEQLRQEYARLRQEYWMRSQALDQQLREVSEKNLALEEYRQRFVLRSQDAAAVEGKLDRLRKRWVQENAELVKTATEQFALLHAEAAHLQQRGRELLKVAEDLTEREAALAKRQVNWEEHLTLAEATQTQLRHRLESAQARQARTERQVAELQADVQCMAGVLLDEVEEPPHREVQAA